jgi:hypothetical protein
VLWVPTELNFEVDPTVEDQLMRLVHKDSTVEDHLELWVPTDLNFEVDPTVEDQLTQLVQTKQRR